MPVFKAYFRVLKKVIPSIVIYVGIFITIAVLATVLPQDNFTGGFEQADVPIAIIDREGNSPLVEGMKKYLGQTNTLVELEDEPDQLQDALFFRKVQYILMVPAGYTDSFLTGGSLKIDKLVVPDSVNAAYLDLMVDRYWNTARLYLADESRNAESIAAGVAESLAVHSDVTMTHKQIQASENNGMVVYFNYMAYIFLAVIILSISTVLMAFNRPDIRLRNQCGPIPPRSISGQLILGNGLLAMAIWGLLVIFSLIIGGDTLVSGGQIALLFLNSFVFMTVCVGIGFLAGRFIHNGNIQSAVSNVISLGMSFLCGVFVPQSLLSSPVLAVARFLPTYWFVRANNQIGQLADWNNHAVSPIFLDMLIQLGFAVAIFSVGMLLSRQRRLLENR